MTRTRNNLGRNTFGLLCLLTSLVPGMAGGASAQNPGGISTAPIEWLRADSITGQADGSAVSSWTAKAGPTVSQSAAAQDPVYHASGPNGKPYVNFTANAVLTTSALTQAAGSYTIYAVARIPDTSTTASHWAVDNQTGRFVVYPSNGTPNGGGWYDGAFHAPSTGGTSGTWVIYSWVFNAGASTGVMYASGTQVGTGPYTPQAFGGLTAFGNGYDSAPGATSAAVGDMAEVIIFPTVLSSADQSSVATYLTSEYTAPSTVSIAPNDPGILYPAPIVNGVAGSWTVTATAAKTINTGAYLRTLLSGTATCAIGLNIGTATPYSQVYARLSGGPWQKYVPTASGPQTWPVTMPTGTTAPKALLELVTKSMTQTQDRWNTQATAVQFTGLTLDAGASVSAPARRKYLTRVHGTSITEGVRVNGFSGIPNDTDQNDVTLDYSYRLGELLDSEMVIEGFGGSGLAVTGSGNVPPLPQSYNLLWAGQPADMATVYDLEIYEEATNDSLQSVSASAVSSALTSVIGGIGYAASKTTHAGLAGTRHLVLEPFGGYFASTLQAAVSGINSPNVVYGDTTGLFNTADSPEGVHPYGYVQIGTLAPGVAALAMPLLHPAATLGIKRKVQ